MCKRLYTWLPILLLGLACGATSLAQDQDLSPDSTLSGVLDRGKLKVCFEAGYMPFEMIGTRSGLRERKFRPADERKGAQTTRFGGFDIDLGREMARELGVDFVPVNTRWTSIIPSLVLGRCDVIISGMSITEERRATRTASRQYQELEREHRGSVRAARVYLGQRVGYFAMRECPEVPGGDSILRQRGSNGVARRIVVSEAVRDRPLQDRANTSAHLLRRDRLGGPNRQQDAHHVGRGDVAYTTSSDSRHCMVAKRCPPLLGRLAAVLPSRRMHLDDLVGRLCKGRYNRVGCALWGRRRRERPCGSRLRLRVLRQV